MNFELRVAGPDTIDVMTDELEALRLANAVNKQYLADCAAHPGNEVLCVATVHAVEQDENLPELPTCTKSQTGITGGFGITMDLERGTMRQWVMGRDGVKLWADSGEPTEPLRCKACRETGAIHCSDPENCGGPWTVHNAPHEGPGGFSPGPLDAVVGPQTERSKG